MLGEEETPTDSLAFLCVGCGGGVVEGGRWTGGEGWSGGGQTAGGRSGHDQTRHWQDWLGCSTVTARLGLTGHQTGQEAGLEGEEAWLDRDKLGCVAR